MASSAHQSDLRFACLSGLDGLASVAPALDELARRGAAAGERPWFFVSGDWLLPFARHCAQDAELHTFVARDAQDQVVAVLPLAKRTVRIGRLQTPALTMLGWPVTDNVEIPAVDDASRQALLGYAWKEARAQVRGWSCLMLREIDAAGPTLAAIHGLQQAGVLPRPEEFPAGVSPVLDLEQFFADGDPRTKKQLYRITKFRRKLAKQGEVEVPFWRVGAGEWEQIWQNAVDIESRSWKGEDGDATSLQEGPGAALLREVWERVVPRGELACCEVRLDGKPLASHWGFIEGGRFLSFHMAYDNDYRSYGLGSVMLEDMVQTGREIGLRVIDASRGNPAGTHILGQYGCPSRQQVQVVLPRRNPAGVWVRMHCKARRARARRAEQQAAASA